MKCSRQKEQPSSEPAADSSQSETLHRTVSAIAGHLRRKKLTSILARLSNKVEVAWEGGRAEETRAFYALGNARSESLRYFLRDEVGLSEKSIRDWVKNLETEGEISIPNVILDKRRS